MKRQNLAEGTSGFREFPALIHMTCLKPKMSKFAVTVRTCPVGRFAVLAAQNLGRLMTRNRGNLAGRTKRWQQIQMQAE